MSNEKSESGKKIRGYTNDAIKYLEKREEFWRQQDPSKTHDKTYERAASGTKASNDTKTVSKKSDPGKYVIKQIEDIETGLFISRLRAC